MECCWAEDGWILVHGEREAVISARRKQSGGYLVGGGSGRERFRNASAIWWENHAYLMLSAEESVVQERSCRYPGASGVVGAGVQEISIDGIEFGIGTAVGRRFQAVGNSQTQIPAACKGKRCNGSSWPEIFWP